MICRLDVFSRRAWRGFSLLALVAARDPFEAFAEPASRPNILFCIADDASYPHMGAYGCDWVNTPAFDRVAREGLLFTRAYTPNAKCAPSRACILTGRNSWQLEAAANHVPFFPPKFRTYAEALAGRGYFVGKTTKGWAPGIALDEAGKPRELVGRAFDKRKLDPPASGISPSDYAANFEDFLAAAPDGAPWCFWYGALEPHRAYEYGSGAAKGGKRVEDVDSVPDYWPDNEIVRNDMLDYAFEIEHFDRHLGAMLESLERRGALENTIVVVTADNGAPFPRVKGQAYEASNHLPLAIMWKNGIRDPGRTVDELVGFIDFAPTFLEAAGLPWKDSGMADSPGRSLLPVFRDDPDRARREFVLVGKERHDVGRPNDWGYPVRGIVTERALYIRNWEPDRWPAGNPETGYLNCDASPTKTEILRMRRAGEDARFWEACFGKRPAEEFFPLHGAEFAPDEAESLKREMERTMLRALEAEGDPRVLGDGAVFERYPYAQEGMRGFYEKYMAGEAPRAGWVEESDFEPEPIAADSPVAR